MSKRPPLGFTGKSMTRSSVLHVSQNATQRVMADSETDTVLDLSHAKCRRPYRRSTWLRPPNEISCPYKDVHGHTGIHARTFIV